MTRTNLRILQLNIKKSRPCMEAIINDSQTRHLDILLIQEPPVRAYKTHVNHRLWHLYQPTCATEAGTTRSLLYVNKRLTTSLHRQIQCDDPDITAIQIYAENQQLLIFSVYIPPIDLYRTTQPQTIQPTLTIIHNTIQEVISNNKTPTKIILAGDFNRHHPT